MGGQHGGPVFRGPAFRPLTADDPTAVAGHRVGALLGDGALGRVYFAHAPDGLPVALTVIRPELAELPGFADRFPHDAQAAGRVRSRYAVPVTGSGADPAVGYWFASAYVPALSLYAAVDGAGPLPVGGVLRLVAGIAEALAAVHHAGAVHGDLRPSHVLLAADGPRVTDYGIAPAAGGGLLTGSAEEDGTPVFRSPEQAAGRQSGPAADVFALGQLAAYAATGVAPFGRGPVPTVLARVAQEEADLSELPGELREIVTRCLIKDPALRPSPAQIIAMCGQAAPDSLRRRADPWLPPALLAALVPPMPPPAPPIPVAPPPPVRPPGHGWTQHNWPAGWARPVHLHVPRPHGRGRRRTAAVAGTLTGLALVATAGVALAGGFDGRSDRPAQARAIGSGSGASGYASPPAPGDGAGSPPGDAAGDATGTPVPPLGSVVYEGVELPAGYALSSLHDDPPRVREGSATGVFGYTADAAAFVADPGGTLAVLDPAAPATPAACRAAPDPRPSFPRSRATPGTRLCITAADGSTALITFRTLTPLTEPGPRATLTLTIWPTQPR